MNILGLSCHYHDSAAVLLQDGVLVAAAEEERFSRVKHDSSFPNKAIAFCLAAGGVPPQDIDYVVFYEKPLAKFDRVLMTTLGIYPAGWRVFREAMTSWLRDRLWIRGRIVRALEVAADRILFVDHHLSHAASAFFCSPFDSAALLTVDGVGEWTTASIGRAHGGSDSQAGGRITVDADMPFPHSLGLLYSAFTAYLGFEVNEGEYKVMGLAPYGHPKYVDDVRRMVHVQEDGSLRLNLHFFGFADSVDYGFGRRFVDLFGPPRRPGSAFFTQGTHPRHDHPLWSPEAAAANQKYADIAASIQLVTEEALLAMARAVHRRTGLGALCLAGGVAFNSVAVGRLVSEGPFDKVFIQPAAGDAGGALGAALYGHHVLLGSPGRFVMNHAYWGEGHEAGEIADTLRRAGISFEELDEQALLDRATAALLQGKVVGWFQGRFEWGPRALGNRSLLADPRSASMKDVLNRQVKRREEFRPFAPVVVEERARDYFDLPPGRRSEPARFMQVVHAVREGAATSLAAVDHFGTSRPQTLLEEQNPLCYSLLRRFGEATGHPVLLNTSFNLKGEPIVASPDDALSTYRRSGLDVLVMDHFMVDGPG